MSAQSLNNLYNKENAINEEAGFQGTFAEQNKCKSLYLLTQKTDIIV
jgi:hypothetical protein